ncbi:putative MFS family arabinose efflux permease [Krasilnikovia cinnamomea]|uniref:Putative MFS family arabinose efflux permease n=1 Tax=Krasilnikovia cinnamomea TaxID=349313 RepID=A0A4Q7ZSH0_9ACTN|nr:MFS transporter [Krasilnikovia cinnamomea]RZU54138.1 putative MFS family arabinose efflux permease [Krasilnikovia cinnamomea]
MSERTETASHLHSERTGRVGARWIGLLSLANLGLWLGYFGPLQVLLPNQVEQLAGGGKATALGVVTGLGALVAVVVGPLAGALSDATTARTGRRRTWIAGGALVGCAGLALLAVQDDLAGVVVAWCLAQAGLNALQAGLTAVVPDQVPVPQRGLVSGWVGLTQSAGVVVAVLLAASTGGATGYVLTGVVVVLAVAPFAVTMPDRPAAGPRPARAADRPRAGRGRDFGWAWATRFLVQLGNAMATLYLLYFLRDEVRFEQLFPGRSADDGLALLIVVYTAATLVTVVTGGWVSDRVGRRKPSVIVSGYVMAAATALLAFWPTWAGALVAAAVLGLGFGVYLSVDQALITEVLPSARDRARDLGIINIANSAPQVLGPVVAVLLVEHLGGYPALYLAAAAVTALGSVLVTRIRSVR